MVKRFINQVEDVVDSWFNPLIRYLSNRVLPVDKKKVHVMVRKSKSYVLV